MRKFQNKSKECTKKELGALHALKDKHYLYLLCLKKEVERKKAESCSWGGQDEVRLIQEFNKMIIDDVNDTIKCVTDLIDKAHWKLTKKKGAI